MFNLSIPSQSFCMSLNESLVLVFFCLFVTLMLPKLKTGTGTLLTSVLLSAFVFANTILDPFPNFRLEISLPVLILTGGYFIVLANRIFKAKRNKKKAASDSSETDKALGLFYQQQGMLDLAFEKFQSISCEDDVSELLYNLGLEYENKDQIKKALGVYKLIARGKRDDENLEKRIPGPEHMESDMFIGAQRDGQSAMPLDKAAGTTIGRYEVSEEIGQDSIGVIFRGQDIETGSGAAILTVKLSGFDDDHISEIRARFFRETECLPQLTHSNIVTVYECGEEPDMFYVAAENVEVEDLKNYSKKGQLLPIRETLSIIGHASEALDYAHRKNVIHQYIRPDSIIRVKETKNVKVRNFGIGWIPSAFRSKTDTLTESHCYMSPEQIAGKKVDGRSDIFSLGTVLFEMLTGERPFSGEDMPSIMLSISKERHPSPRHYNPKIPRVIEQIIDSALEKDLEKRYQSAGQMASHLKKVVARIDELMEQKRKISNSSEREN